MSAFFITILPRYNILKNVYIEDYNTKTLQNLNIICQIPKKRKKLLAKRKRRLLEAPPFETLRNGSQQHDLFILPIDGIKLGDGDGVPADAYLHGIPRSSIFLYKPILITGIYRFRRGCGYRISAGPGKDLSNLISYGRLVILKAPIDDPPLSMISNHQLEIMLAGKTDRVEDSGSDKG
jgi:hypothetical protein